MLADMPKIPGPPCTNLVWHRPNSGPRGPGGERLAATKEERKARGGWWPLKTRSSGAEDTAPQGPAPGASPAASGQAVGSSPAPSIRVEPPPPVSAEGSVESVGPPRLWYRPDESSDENDVEGADAPIDIAAKAVKKIRKTYYTTDDYLKSSTKIRSGFNAGLEDARRKEAEDEIRAWRNMAFMFASKAEAYGHYKRARAHNCGELSLLAAELLDNAGFRAVTISFGKNKDHACAAILPAGHPGGELDPDMKQWDEGIVICDVWANIACAPPDYEERFNERMQKWARALKEVLFEGRRITPTDPRWINLVVGGPKRVNFDSSRFDQSSVGRPL
jgi:hypothetical protein